MATQPVKFKLAPRATLKMKGNLTFPARVLGSSGILISESGGTYTFSLDPTYAGVGYFTGIGIGAPWSTTPTQPLEMTTTVAAAFIKQTNSGSTWLIGPTTGVDTQGWGLFSVTGNAYRIRINNTGVVTIGQAGLGAGSLNFENATSGNISIAPPTGALGSKALTLPSVPGATGVLVARDSTDALTNKALDSSTVGATTRGTGAFTALGVGAAAPVSTTQPVQITTATAAAQIGQTNSGSTWAFGPSTGVSAAGWGIFSTTAGAFRITINDTGGVALPAYGTGILHSSSVGLLTSSAVDLSSADVTGNLPVNKLNSGTGASATTFWRGDGTWVVPTGAGDFVGPGSSTANAVVRFSGTTGKLGQNSGVIIDASNNTSGIGTLASAAHTITSAGATALAVGLNGTANPALNIDASTASSATGINIKSAAAAGGVAVSVISSGTNENLTIDAKGSGTISLNNAGTGQVVCPRTVRLSATSAALWMNRTTSLAIAMVEYDFAGNAIRGITSNDTTTTSGAVHVYFASGGTNVGVINTTSTTTAYVTSSDGRLKSNRAPIPDPRGAIMSIEPVEFNWNNAAGEPRDIGFVAQDVKAALPLLPGVNVGDENPNARPGDEGFRQWGLDYARFTPYLWAGLRDAYNRIDALEARLAELERRIS